MFKEYHELKKPKTLKDLYVYCKKNNYEIILRKGNFKGFIKTETPKEKDLFKAINLRRI